MPLNPSIPTPVLCRNDYDTNLINVTPYTQAEWDSDTLGRIMLVRSDDGGVNWLACANLAYGEGGFFDAGLVYGYTLFRYETWGVPNPCGVQSTMWWAVADIELPTPPTGFHYEYSWDGTTFYNWPNGYHPWFPFGILTPGPSTQEFSATIIANLVNNNTDEVECTDTDTLEVTLTKSFEDWEAPAGGRPDGTSWGETLENADWCFGGPSVEVLNVTLSPTSGCPGDTVTATSSHTLTAAILRDGLGATVATLALTHLSDFVYTFPVPAVAGFVDILFTTAAEIDTQTDIVAFALSEDCEGEPPEEGMLEVGWPVSTCPGVTLRFYATHPLDLVQIFEVDYSLEISAEAIDTSGLTPVAILSLTPATPNYDLYEGMDYAYSALAPALPAGYNYLIRFRTSSNITDRYDNDTYGVPEDCESELPTPAAPDILGYDDNSNELILPPLPTHATHLRLWRKRAGDSGYSVFAQTLAGNARVPVGTLDTDVRYDYYTTGYNADNESVPSSGIYLLNPGGGGGGTDPEPETEIPAIPNAPTLSKNCEDETIGVTSPAFVTTGNAQTGSIDIRRRTLPDGDWETVHTFEAPGSWIDEAVQPLAAYEYGARACNLSGCSNWSSAATISLVSSTLALVWQSPGEDAEVRRHILLRFRAADSGGVSDLQVFVNGALLSAAPKRVSGTAANGVYMLALDTRRAAQGASTVMVIGTGSDGCKKRAELQLTFANTRALGVLYRDFHTQAARGGQEIVRLPVSVGLGELDSDPSRRFWGQLAVTKNMATPVVTDATEPADAQTAFDAMQPFPLALSKSWPQLGANPPGSVLYGIQSMNAPGAQMKLRVRIEQAEGFLAYDTGGERIPKIRAVSAGKHLVLAQNPDRVFVFQEDSLTLLADLQEEAGATAVSDAALVGDKVYFLNGEQLIAFDINPLTGARQRTMNISPHAEARRPTLIESVGGRLIALFVDEDLPEEQTLCVSLKTDQFNDAWSLDKVATLAWSNGSDLYFACGGELYRSIGGTATPALVGSFGAAITAITADAVGLADGSLWVLKEGEWTNPVLAGGAAINAATRAYLGFEYIGALWGRAASPTLFGQDASGGYGVSRALGTYDGVAAQPSGIAALDRYYVPSEETESEAPEGETGEGEEDETAGDERVLIGTEGGVLLALSVARQSSASAWLHSSITDIEAGGVARLVPVVEEEAEV